MNIAYVSIPRTAQTLFAFDVIIVGLITSLFSNIVSHTGLNTVLLDFLGVRLFPVLGYGPALIYSAAVLGTLFVMGLYQRAYMRGMRLIKSGLTAALLAWLLAGWPIAETSLPKDGISVVEFLILHAALFITLIMMRAAVCLYYEKFARKPRMALVGSKSMQNLFSSVQERVVPADFVVAKTKQLNCASDKDDLKDVLRDLSVRRDIDQIIIDLPSHEVEALRAQNILKSTHESTVELVPKSDAIERCARWSETGEALTAVANVNDNSLARIAKRWIEMLLALGGLIFVMPVLIVVFIAIKLDDGGPIFYRQKRVGKDGREFFVLKIRSMITDAEADGKARWAQIGDSRITRIGRFIRMTRIDELPQLINVIRGDMALVGPRPERPEIVRELERNIPGYELRHAVRPGLTGWAQINFPYSANLEDAARKTQLDFYYIKNWSIWLDLAIIAQTARIVLFAEGAR